MIIAIYSRKSIFDEQSDSVGNQIQMCQDYAQKHFTNIQDILIYEDEGFSGANTKRPQFQKLLQDAKKKKFSTLICYRLDRISRSVSDFSSVITMLETSNISFVSIKEQFDTSTPMGRAMMYIASVFAQLERETIAERVRDNMLQLAKVGRWTGGTTPIGFTSEPVPYFTDEGGVLREKKMHYLTPVESEAELVRELFNQYIHLGSLSKLEKWCYLNNVKTRLDKHFDRATLQKILINPVYSTADMAFYEYCKAQGMNITSDKGEFDGIHGVISYNKQVGRNTPLDKTQWLVAIAKHKGIVPSATWIEAQNVMERNKGKSPRSETGKNGALIGLARCSCGAKLRAKPSGSGKYFYYSCQIPIKTGKVKCQNSKSIRMETAEEAVFDEIKKLKMNQGHLVGQFMSMVKQSKVAQKNSQTEISRVEKQLEEAESSIKTLTGLLSKNKDSAAAKYIIEEIEVLDKKTSDLRRYLRELRENDMTQKNENQNVQLLRQAILNIPDTIDTMSTQEKRKFLKGIIKDIVWDGTNLTINLLGV